MEWRHNDKIFKQWAVLAVLLLFCSVVVSAQQQYELNSGWKCIRASSVNKTGEEISKTNFPLTGWIPAVVPGTVLTSLLYNHLIPDPFYGMNNEHIPDIYKVGRGYYTYWFTKDFTEKFTAKDGRVWLQFRGVNNSCDVFLNGHKVNSAQYKSMYLRQEYDITPFLAKDGHNRLAVIVYPPDPVGNPNGGQGGDGTIAHGLTNQYVAGWDWIQPVRDRNTGIWDKVLIKRTKEVTVANTHVVTLVPGARLPNGKQEPAIVSATTEVDNATNGTVNGTLVWEMEGYEETATLSLGPGKQIIGTPDITLDDPKLWWPNGYGKQPLYSLKVKFLVNGKTKSDEEQVTFGVREIKSRWNAHTQSREIQVNGQKIFIKGGNRILSDEMLRFSPEWYDAEVRYHRDMNLNLIRVWGGGITERPEFYDACDKYGILVMQDFWVSGDCNGRWDDPLKLEDTNARKNYPDDHRLFVETLTDQIKMLRNHPSLAIWCGGNEIRPPADVLGPLRDSLLPQLDGTRIFFEYSNDDSMSYQAYDGPYTIQSDTFFWSHRSYGFNSEVGSVGIGDYESLQRFIPKENMVVPFYDTSAHKWKVDSVWQYHKYSGYDSAIEAYGHPKDIKDFAMKAQLVNYDQYRALMEGASAHMWDWYTGIIEWKTQNPWTAMVGQMYDVYLDPNACMFGLQEGAKPVHIMYDPVHRVVLAVNNTFEPVTILPELWFYEQSRAKKTSLRNFVLQPASVTMLYDFEKSNDLPASEINKGVFLGLVIYDFATDNLDNNIYSLPDTKGNYNWLSGYQPSDPEVTASYENDSLITVSIKNGQYKPMAFFNHISLVDKKTNERILPVFCNNNYISVPPGELRTVSISFAPRKNTEPIICVEGWNVHKQFIEIKK
jgi:hypothetical protein